jgi:hypothetical protein
MQLSGPSGEERRASRLAKRKYTKLAPKSSGTFVCKPFTQEAARTLDLLASWQNSPLLEIPRVLVRLDHVPSRIANANHGIV